MPDREIDKPKKKTQEQNGLSINFFKLYSRAIRFIKDIITIFLIMKKRYERPYEGTRSDNNQIDTNILDEDITELDKRNIDILCSLIVAGLLSLILLILTMAIVYRCLDCTMKTSPPWVLITTIITAPLVLYPLYQRFRHKEEDLDLERKRQIAERFSRAAKMLSSDSRVERAGGVCEMEFISRHSKSHHGEVLDAIAIFIREKSPWNEKKSVKQIAKTPEDIQAALRFLGRRKHRDSEKFFINLESTDLRKACFDEDSHFEGAYFAEAHLERATLIKVNLGKNLKDYKTNFNNAHLEGVQFRGADLSDAILIKAHLEGANFEEANLDKVNAKDALYDDLTIIPDKYSYLKEYMIEVDR